VRKTKEFDINSCMLLTLGAILLWTSLASAVPVYRFHDSPFPSGESSPKNLDMTGLTISKTWLKIRWSNHEGLVPRQAIYNAIDLSKRALLLETTPYRKIPQENRLPAGVFQKNTDVEIISQQDHWVLIKNKKISGWVSENFLKAHPHDLGFMLTNKKTHFKLSPDIKSKTLYEIPEKRKVTCLEKNNSWVKIKYRNKIGWVSVHHVFSKLDTDFAIIKIKTKPQNSTSTDNLEFGQKVQITDHHTTQWVKSKTPEHGHVWWLFNQHPTQLQVAKSTLETKELFDRGLYDMAAHPQMPLIKFASAQGVFLTTDDKNWQIISEFGHQNFPVAIANNGDIYVGHYRSQNQGESFQPYLRWDKIISKITEIKGYTPQNLRLTDIDLNDNSNAIVITLSSAKNSNKDEIRLMSTNGGKFWKLANEKTPSQWPLLRNLANRNARLSPVFLRPQELEYEHKRPASKLPN